MGVLEIDWERDQMCFLVGIDDTDNVESRGTGYRVRQLGKLLTETHIETVGITRHQLLVDPRIPYTSHNSSVCLAVACEAARETELVERCRDFLVRESAAGSDAGLCVARREQVNEELIAFGQRAKMEVLARRDAEGMARSRRVRLEAVTGTGVGVIGALAAVGLRAGGNDGRLLWLPGLRELSGIFTAAQLRTELRLDAVETEAGENIRLTDRIRVRDWTRPVMRAGRSVLVVQEARHEEYDWLVVSKQRIKQLSE